MIPHFYAQIGEGFPVVLVHGFPFNADLWLPQKESLAKHCSLVTFDLPGFARGGEAVSGTTMESCADMTIALLDRLHYERAVIGGLSMGGYIAMAALRKYPERFAGAILADTRAEADVPEAAEKRRNQAAAIRANGTDEFIETMLGNLLSEHTRQNTAEVVEQLRSIMQAATPEGTATMLEAMAARSDSLDTLRRLSIPVCILVGSDDTLTTPAMALRMHEAIHGSELHSIPKAGHVSNMEQPETFNAIVAAFLQKHQWG